MEPVIVKYPRILSGEPVFRGTRVPFKALTDYLEGGETLDKFLEQYPKCDARSSDRRPGRSPMWLNGAPGVKVLVDERAPKKLKSVLAASGHDCTTVQEAGWSGKENGELLTDADARFDVLVTVDQNIRYQQNLTGRKIAVVIIRAPSNRLDDLEPHFPACIAALRFIQPGTVVEVGLPTEGAMPAPR